MKLFLLEQSPLPEIMQADIDLSSGDIVAFFREAQDPEGECSRLLGKRGVTCFLAEGLVDNNHADRIDAFIDHFLNGWFLDEKGRDPSIGNGVSMAFILNPHVINRDHPNLLVRFGETCRLILESNPGVTEIITDIEDCVSPITNAPLFPASLPRRWFLKTLSKNLGIPLSVITPVNPVPSLRSHDAKLYYRSVVKSYLGGFRWSYLRSRLKRGHKTTGRNRIYVFINHGVRTVAESLCNLDRLDVYADQAGVRGVLPLRCDHFFAIPSFSLMRAVIRLRRHIQSLKKRTDWGFFEGIDYRPFFIEMLRVLTGTPLVISAIKVAQTQKMLRYLNPDYVVINGETPVTIRTVISCKDVFGYKIFHIGHGLIQSKFGYSNAGCNFENVTFLIPGEGHRYFYAPHLPSDRQPEKIVLTSSLALQMKQANGRHQYGRTAKRILLLNYCANDNFTVARACLLDRYMLDIFNVAKKMADEGYIFSFRPHFGDEIGYIQTMIKLADAEDAVSIDNSPNFADALLKNDIVVSNSSTCYYQSLISGWPTIYFEPRFDPRYATGLIVDEEAKVPLASTKEDLKRLIIEAGDSKSYTGSFPGIFINRFADKYIGKDCKKADQVITDYLSTYIQDSRAH